LFGVKKKEKNLAVWAIVCFFGSVKNEIPQN
jgi:hypothetical protein